MSASPTRFSTADLCDLYWEPLAGSVQQARPGLVSFGGRHMCYGPAMTVSTCDDNVLIRELVASPGNGRILVIDGSASSNRALLGDVQTMKAMKNGWAGLIINGYVRDRELLAALPFAVFALGTVPLRPLKTGSGKIGGVVNFLDVTIAPDNWVYADADGLIVSAVALDLPSEAPTED
ncbi:Putative 4-hydroxy-4-methyl-2-oxoglutarate aldolase [Pseudomonas fluorescens]|uniref:ribonuclease E activity regulator RraA n=1 Tax=Pseudomonas fluorescens TaxID=294 RepID=UPI0012581A66|nr:ribonuclease E activity regulator RraA [Pseudomonas fluorescens]VVP38328.1 Putative 4-hydroxy-4-methyl-2-oxoglutarate aldolase [Pseudomonas fluorescens]